MTVQIRRFVPRGQRRPTQLGRLSEYRMSRPNDDLARSSVVHTDRQLVRAGKGSITGARPVGRVRSSELVRWAPRQRCLHAMSSYGEVPFRAGRSLLQRCHHSGRRRNGMHVVGRLLVRRWIALSGGFARRAMIATWHTHSFHR